ncbi:unnamed protein product [Clonostachys rosea f. rosea IK726]|jgi:carboxylesterase type B|uniref:Carboxylic ester hydrolase n=2 Tax=Bionectria ochroleuca TaxID=29856 RepID=A0A0B7KAE5_BIOOC|nr:unnamed protein product [Clonostachys rosea f. rosea IK726]
MVSLKNIFTGAAQTVLCLGASTQDPVVLKGYGSFTGTLINSTLSGASLAQDVDAWLGIDYATQPVGDGRFRPVTWPSSFRGVKAATSYGKSCIQATSSISEADQDEACLNFNVFRPSGIPRSQKLPVLVWIHGGAFYAGGWRNFDGPSFVASSKQPVIVVTFHYRVNSLGFISSPLFEEEGLLNLGIRDQHLLLKFVQRHISSFGGDPDSVTIGGRSAGGHSVGIHYFHNYGEDEGKPLFARAIHQSGSVTARAFPDAHYPLYAEQTAKYLSYLGCNQGLNNAATLSCLRSADIGAIRNISVQLYNDYNEALTWPFQPTKGGPLLEKFGSQSGYDGTFFHVPVITSSVTDEGKFYIPGDKETNDEFLDYLHNISPALTSDDLSLLESLYSDPATDPSSPFANSPNSTQYNRLAAAWSDYAYICPSQETAYRASLAGVPTWKVRFDTNNNFPDWQGIPHTADTRYTWDEPLSVQYPDVSHIYHGYLSSFVVSGDPNTYRYEGSPSWPQYEVNQANNGSLQLTVRPLGGTKVDLDNIRTEACRFWRDPARAARLNK